MDGALRSMERWVAAASSRDVVPVDSVDGEAAGGIGQHDGHMMPVDWLMNFRGVPENEIYLHIMIG